MQNKRPKKWNRSISEFHGRVTQWNSDSRITIGQTSTIKMFVGGHHETWRVTGGLVVGIGHDHVGIAPTVPVAHGVNGGVRCQYPRHT